MRPGPAVIRPVVLLVIGMSLLVSGCGNTSQSDLAKAKVAGASEEAAKQKEARQQQEQAKLAAEVKKLKDEAAKAKKQASRSTSSAQEKAAPLPAPRGRSCGGNLSVGPDTSCAFAANVEAAFYSAGGGTNSVEVYSPVTGRYYSMSCVAGVPSACRGGNNAVVYIR